MANNQIFEKQKKDEFEIKIKVTPKKIERAFFIIVILVLSYFAFFGKIENTCETDKTTTGATIITDTSKTTTTEKTINITANKTQQKLETPVVVVQEEKPVVNETKITTNTTNTTQPTPQPKTYNGKIELTVENIESETGTYVSGTDWGKIKKVTFVIDNQKGDVMPKIQVYTYTSSSSTIMKTMIRGEVIYSEQIIGEKKEHSLDIESQPFTGDDLNDPVTVKVVLKDQKTDTIIQTVEEEYTFD